MKFTTRLFVIFSVSWVLLFVTLRWYALHDASVTKKRPVVMSQTEAGGEEGEVSDKELEELLQVLRRRLRRLVVTSQTKAGGEEGEGSHKELKEQVQDLARRQQRPVVTSQTKAGGEKGEKSDKELEEQPQDLARRQQRPVVTSQTKARGQEGVGSDKELEELLQVLERRQQRYNGPKLNMTQRICKSDDGSPRACHDPSCPGHFSTSLRDRLKQVLSTRATIPANYMQAMSSAAQSVKSHKYIFVTGASSNHFQEMQTLLQSVFKSLFRLMKGEDYAFVVYNLGLTERERNLTKQYCRCTLVDFPFSKLPAFVKHLQCYSWKPLIMASLLEKAEYLIWMDASIRFQDSDPLQEMFRRARENGYQTKFNYGSIAIRTKPSMAEFFGDHLCQYSPFTEMPTGFIIFYNDRFTREAIMKPWVSCALNRTCICVENYITYRNCTNPGKERAIGICHRYEQSAIAMIFSKLYLENRPMLYVPGGSIKVKRDEKMNWFSKTGH